MSHAPELARYARARLEEHLGGGTARRPEGAWADEPSGTFVTLRWSDGRLQGCIGNLDPHRAIADDVAENAVAAGTLDPRAEPLSLSEVADLDVELSILSPLEAVPAEDEASALAQLEPEVHGVVFTHGRRRSTFLPVMWSHFPDAESFMAALKEKAGYPGDFWDRDVRVYRYTVDKHVDRARTRS